VKLAVGLLICLVAYSQAPPDAATVVKLLKAGVGEDTIVSLIRQQPGARSITPDEAVAIKNAGGSDKLLSTLAGQAGKVTLHDGTPIRMRLTRTLSYVEASVNDPVDFEVLDDLKVDGTIVIARRSLETGTFIRTEPKKWSRGDKLGVNLEKVRLLNGEKVPVRAVKEGEKAVAFLFLPTRDTLINQGTEITAYVDGEVSLDRAAFAGTTDGMIDMSFSSNPQGAVVRIYGTVLGRTPFVTRLQPGTYRAVFSVDGYVDLTQNFVVGPGRGTLVNAPFELK
jgi:hypothetical protein